MNNKDTFADRESAEPSLNARLRNFLLGTLSDEERAEIEQQLLADISVGDLLLATEEELLDEYISGSLDAPEVQSFLEYMRNLPDGQQRIVFARDLRSYLSHHQREMAVPLNEVKTGLSREPQIGRAAWMLHYRAAWSAAALAAALGVGFATGAWIFSRPPRNEAYVAYGRSAPTVLLTGDALRSGGSLPVVTVSPSQLLLEIVLDIGSNEHESYKASVHDVDARELFAVSQVELRINSERISVAFRVPTDLLSTGDYFVSLFGADDGEPLGRYDFRVLVQ